MEQKLAHYTIKEQLGEGSFAWVHRAYDHKFEQDVALKVLKPVWLSDPQAIGRFKQEAITARKLRHPHIIDIYDVGEAEGQVYLALLLVEGETLAEKLKREGPMTWDEVVKIISAIGDALDYAHGQGIIHRDIKPENILLGTDNHAYLGDFGLVLAVEGSARLSASGGMVGTGHYMAPEVWDGKKATPETDVYALSCVIYEMLMGETLFEGSSMMAVLKKHAEGPKFPATWSTNVPDGVTEVLKRGLSENPAERISSAGELAAALAAVDVSTAKEKRLWLVSSAGQHHALRQGSMIIGRAKNADIQVDNVAVSRQHATLEFDGKRCTVFDEDSANGTFVNGQRVGSKGVLLNPGDELKIGDEIFTLSAAEATSPVPAAVPAAKTVDKRADTTIIPAQKAKPEPDTAAGPAPQPPATTPAAADSPAKKGGPPWLIIGGVGAVTLVALICIGALVFFRPGPDPTPTPEPPTEEVAKNDTIDKDKEDLLPTDTPTPEPDRDATETVIADQTATSVAATEMAIADETATAIATTATQTYINELEDEQEAEAARKTATAEAQKTATAKAHATATAQAIATANAIKPEVEFFADSETIEAGECTTLRWSVSNAREAYFDGTGVVGQGSREVCPSEDATYVLQVVEIDGEIQETAITIAVEQPAVPTSTPTPPTIIDALGVPMVLVPEGPFDMGSENGESDERPIHTVVLDAFYIDKFEVTNAQYETCVNAGKCASPQNNVFGNSDFDDHPVTNVNWDEANAYCAWREARLPTEAEWEKAARGTDGRKYPWGNQEPTNSFGNFEGSTTTLIGSYPAGVSPYGVYDMLGNVAEYTADWYDASYYSQSPSQNPLGPPEGQTPEGRKKVTRGWYSNPVPSRHSNTLTNRMPIIGFRCARNAQ